MSTTDVAAGAMPHVADHDFVAFCALLEEAGADVVVTEHDPGNPDAIYTYDATLVGADGAVLLQPGKDGRRREPEATVPALERVGIPVVGRVELPVTVEGGDTVWLDESTLLVGIGYRTSAGAPEALRALFPGVEVIAFDAIAQALAASVGETVGKRVTVWGRIKDEEFTPKGAKRPIRYQVLTLERIKTPEYELPAPEAPTVPMDLL